LPLFRPLADTPLTGYKEFEPYLASRSGASDDDQHGAASDPLFKAGLERMKISTRQYAKRQVKWIQQKLLPAVRKLEEKDVTVVLLDATGEVSEGSVTFHRALTRLLGRRSRALGSERPSAGCRPSTK
jgi:hypothetical protein